MKKIISIIAISLVSLLVIVTVCLALIQSSLINPIQDDAYVIELWNNGERVKVYQTRKSQFSNPEETLKIADKINELVEDSFKDTVLSTLFQQNAFSYGAKVNKESKQLDDILSGEGMFLVFKYYITSTAESKTLTIDGKEYLDEEKLGDVDKTVKYKKMVLQVIDSSNFDDVTVYLEDSTTQTYTTEINDLNSEYNIKILAHQSDLYDYLLELANN